MKMRRTNKDNMKLIVQALVGVWLIAGLALHLASVGLIGLSVIILTTAFNGVTDEHALGKAFEETAFYRIIMAVFFAVAGGLSINIIRPRYPMGTGLWRQYPIGDFLYRQRIIVYGEW